MSEQVLVREYQIAGDFQGGCNQMLRDGYGLHSWRMMKYAMGIQYTCVFVKMQSVPAKSEGMQCR